MFIDRFTLASRENERDYILSGAYTVDSMTPNWTLMPFGIFPKLGLEKIDFYPVTLFCGGSSSIKALLLRLIAMKLGIGYSSAEKPRCMDDYCRFSVFRYTDFNNKDFAVELITKAQSEVYMTKHYKNMEKAPNWSVVQLYEDLIEQPALYILEEPDNGMSLTEQTELASIINDAVKYYGAQFIINTNSPILLGIKNALIYDFDSTHISGAVWSHSPYARLYENCHREIISSHKRIKNDEE